MPLGYIKYAKINIVEIAMAISTIFILAYFIYPSGITEVVSKIIMI